MKFQILVKTSQKQQKKFKNSVKVAMRFSEKSNFFVFDGDWCCFVWSKFDFSVIQPEGVMKQEAT